MGMAQPIRPGALAGRREPDDPFPPFDRRYAIFLNGCQCYCRVGGREAIVAGPVLSRRLTAAPRPG